MQQTPVHLDQVIHDVRTKNAQKSDRERIEQLEITVAYLKQRLAIYESHMVTA